MPTRWWWFLFQVIVLYAKFLNKMNYFRCSEAFTHYSSVMLNFSSPAKQSNNNIFSHMPNNMATSSDSKCEWHRRARSLILTHFLATRTSTNIRNIFSLTSIRQRWLRRFYCIHGIFFLNVFAFQRWTTLTMTPQVSIECVIKSKSCSVFHWTF